MNVFEFDTQLRNKFGNLIVGADECGRGCETSDAEILTRRGWLSCYDLIKTDEVLSLDDFGCINWQQIDNFFIKPFNSLIVELSNSDGLIIKITPDHCFDVLKRICKNKKIIGYKKEYKTFSSIKNNDYLPRTGQWIGENKDIFILKCIERTKHDTRSNNQNFHIPMKTWVAFLGIYLSEGCCVKSNNGNYQIIISQTKQQNIIKIANLLDETPFNFKKCKEGFKCHNKNLWNYLKEFGDCYSKYISQDIKNLPSDLLNIFLDWFILGDGNIYQSSGNRQPFKTIYTSSINLKNDIEEIILKIGKSYTTSSTMKSSNIRGKEIKATCPNYRIVIKNEKLSQFKFLKNKYIEYNGDVFCINLIYHHNFCVRRNGRSYFTGNSIAGPLCAGAVIFPPDIKIDGIKDSKQLDHNHRLELFDKITQQALAWHVSFIHAEEIDRIGINPSNEKAIKTAIEEAEKKLNQKTDLRLVDQSSLKMENMMMMPKFDSISASVAAASIIAKVTHDQYMEKLNIDYPQYDLTSNKGYGNSEHIKLIKKYGQVHGLHRMSFKIKALSKHKQVSLSDLL